MNLLRPLDRWASNNGTRLHVLDWGGEGRTPLLLLHGFAAHAHAFDTLSLALQPHFHVYAMDTRGHGDSDPAQVYGAEAAAGDVDAVVEQLGIGRMILAGLSMGGQTAIFYAATRPEQVEKLVIIDIGPQISTKASQRPPGPPEPETWDSVEQAAQHLYAGNPYPGIHYYRWVVSDSLKTREDGALVWKWHPSIKAPRAPQNIDWWDLLGRIQAPALVLRGAESYVLDREVAEKMASILPNGSFVEIPRAVHTLHEDNPEATLAALQGFLGFGDR